MKVNDLPSVNGFLEWEDHYAALTAHYPNYERRPLIGITGNFGSKGCELAEGYFSCVEAAGGVPVVIPPLDDTSSLLGLLESLDGLLLSGGGDINPLLLDADPIPELHGVNPRRDAMELLLTRLAYDRQLPILGICRGMQVLTVALGGTVMQDIGAALPGARLVKHDQDMPRGFASHTVSATKSSLVGQLLGAALCRKLLSSPGRGVGRRGAADYGAGGRRRGRGGGERAAEARGGRAVAPGVFSAGA